MIIKEAVCDGVFCLNEQRELIPPKEGESVLFENEAQVLFARGKNEGEKLGYANACHELRTLAAVLHTIAERLLKKKEELLTELKPEVIDFSFAIAEKIIRKELSSPAEHERLIAEYIDLAKAAFATQPLTIYLSPDDFTAMQQRFALEVSSIHYLPDPLMRRGDCRIETKEGLLNAQIKRQLEDIREQIS